MARKRVFLDECSGDLGHVFGSKDHVYTAKDFGFAGKGKEDTRVIDEAVKRKSLIVTVNKDFLQYYRDHPMRKRGDYGYGLIFLKASKQLTREQQLRLAIRALEWDDTREHDDLVWVSADGKTRLERLCHQECAAEFPREQTEWD